MSLKDHGKPQIPTSISVQENGQRQRQPPVTTETVDITKLLRDCAQSLTPQNPVLCHQQSFSLHDAMAASQLMDRKMDCCEIPLSQVLPHSTATDAATATAFPRPAPAGLQDPFCPLPVWEDLTLHQVTPILRDQLVRLQSLLSGASVGESTFTCLYAHAPVLVAMEGRLLPTNITAGDELQQCSLEDRMKHLSTNDNNDDTVGNSTPAQWCLFAATAALMDTTEVVRGIIQNADIYEEEDFVANTHDIPFYQIKVDIKPLLERALSMIRGEASDQAQIIRLVLTFFRDFLKACSTLAKLTTDGLHTTLEKTKSVLQRAVQSLQDLRALSKKLSDENGGDDEETKALLHQAFDSFVNRPRVGSAPVRKVLFLEPDESFQKLITITSELDWAVCNLLMKGNSLGRIQRMLDRVTRSDVNILSRSLIILNLYFSDKLLGQFSLPIFIADHMKQVAHLPDACLAMESAQALLHRLAKPIYDNLKLRTMNRNRERAYIEGVMLPDWTTLQHEAHLMDVTYRQEFGLDSSTPPHFSQYCLLIVLRLMERYVTSGVEVGLFHNSHFDLAFAYWYRDFLLSALLNNMTLLLRAKQAEKAKTAVVESPLTASKGKKKRVSKHKNGSEAAATPVRTPEDAEDDLEINVINLKRNLCRGTIRFLAALKQAGVTTDPQFDFTSLRRIFEERFQVFGLVRQPPPLSYEHFLEGSDFSRVAPEDLLRTTQEWFQSCKQTVDQVVKEMASIQTEYRAVPEEEIQSLVKVCIGNSVYVQRLRQIQGDDTKKTKVTFDFVAHDQFCTIKLS